MPFDPRDWEDDAPQVTTNPVAETLLKAAQYIREHGWCQHIWNDEEAVCARMAIRHSMRNTREGVRAREALAAFLGMDNPFEIIPWNDAPGRTADEVIAALEGAALSLQQARHD